MQIALTGFLEKRAPPFMHELWGHLLSAQVSVGGVPRAFVEQKKREMQAQREEHASMFDHVRGPPASDRRAPPPPDRRWDRGRAPVEADRRRDVFVDKRGNVTRRERDHGWVRTLTDARGDVHHLQTVTVPRRGTYATSLGAMCLQNGASARHRVATSARTLPATVRRHPPRLASADLCNMALYLCPTAFLCMTKSVRCVRTAYVLEVPTARRQELAGLAHARGDDRVLVALQHQLGLPRVGVPQLDAPVLGAGCDPTAVLGAGHRKNIVLPSVKAHTLWPVNVTAHMDALEISSSIVSSSLITLERPHSLSVLSRLPLTSD